MKTPYEDKHLLFERVGDTIYWKSRGQRYASSRQYPTEAEAEKALEKIKERRHERKR